MTENISNLDVRTDASSDDQRRPPLPDSLGSPRAKLVYLYLRRGNGARVAVLQRALGMQALALYPILEMLVDRGLVERTADRYAVTTEDRE